MPKLYWLIKVTQDNHIPWRLKNLTGAQVKVTRRSELHKCAVIPQCWGQDKHAEKNVVE